MDHLPQDPAILVSSINMLLRDEEFDSLHSLCCCYGTTPETVMQYLASYGYTYCVTQRQFRPVGYNDATLSRDAIESAYCFFHQKLRVYQYSTIDWQRDDIEMVISDYCQQMDSQLYDRLAHGQPDFLHSHKHFPRHLKEAMQTLEELLISS